MNKVGLVHLEEQALAANLLLRLKVLRPLGLWSLRVVVADYLEVNKIRVLGEMKAWAYGGLNGLQLDTMRIHPKAPKGVGHLVWSATMAWALEETPCRKARLLAIRDDERQHSRLVKYFCRRGFITVKEVGASPSDLPLRMVWGGAGALMVAECREVHNKSVQLWQSSDAFKHSYHSSSA